MLVWDFEHSQRFVALAAVLKSVLANLASGRKCCTGSLAQKNPTRNHRFIEEQMVTAGMTLKKSTFLTKRTFKVAHCSERSKGLTSDAIDWSNVCYDLDLKLFLYQAFLDGQEYKNTSLR